MRKIKAFFLLQEDRLSGLAPLFRLKRSQQYYDGHSSFSGERNRAQLLMQYDFVLTAVDRTAHARDLERRDSVASCSG